MQKIDKKEQLITRSIFIIQPYFSIMWNNLSPLKTA